MQIVRYAVLAIAAGLLGAPAGAQPEQTIEGGQSFLSQVAAAGGLTFVECKEGVCEETLPDRWVYNELYLGGPQKGQVYKRHERKGIQDAPEKKILKILTLGRCESSFEYTQTEVTYDGEELDDLETRESRLYGASRKWQDISQIKADNEFVRFQMKALSSDRSDRANFRLRTHGPEQAARIAYAMEFLRVNCDPTAATGF